MPNDKFGVKLIYPSINSATDVPKSWFIADGFQNDARVRLDESVTGNGNDGYHLKDNSKVRFTVSADSKDVDIGCDNDFDESTRKGFVYKQNDWMGKANTGVEMTAFYKLSNAGPKDNPIIMKGPTGEHHSNVDCCSGSSHMIHIGGVNEDTGNDIAMRFSKEMWHVDYFPLTDYKAIPGETWSITDNRWFGAKYIIFKKTIDNIKSVVIEVWLNASGDKQTWKKVFTKTDSGGWGKDGNDCGGDSDDRLAFGNARMMWRWDFRDGSDIKFKWNSIRPIDPNADFDEDEPLPDTNQPTITTFRSTLKLQRNINSLTSSCGIGGQQVKFNINDSATYIERSLCNSVDVEYRDIITERANPAGGSSLSGVTPLTFQCMLRKNGTPPGSCNAKIYDSAGNLKYTSINSITATTLPTTFDGSYASFDMSTNTYKMQNGDRIGVSYTASTDTDNDILIKCRDPGDGSTGSYYSWFNDNTNMWSDITGRDIICIVLG